jgi:tRNA pseudouridine55 synthase
MGHGGTLDPLATGILIVGIGRGTKHLSDFLACKKTYETVVLFGKSTDTYDIAGKVVADGPTDHITKSLVEKEIVKCLGKHKQIPPIYSAIKIDGMKLYDYARTGKELPRQLESRDVETSECTLLEYYEPGEHDFRWPAEQASEEEKAVAKKLMNGAEATKQTISPNTEQEKSTNSFVKDEDQESGQTEMARQKKAAMHTHHLPTQEESPAAAPAARVRLTVSSGFYVRSFAYDLGISCGSYGTMAALVRSRQADFTTTEPAPAGYTPTLTYEDLEAGEDVWGPKISSILDKWIETHPEPSAQKRIDDRDRPRFDFAHRGHQNSRGRGGAPKRTWNDRSRSDGYGDHGGSRRRNSSSPEV